MTRADIVLLQIKTKTGLVLGAAISIIAAEKPSPFFFFFLKRFQWASIPLVRKFSLKIFFVPVVIHVPIA